MKKARSNSALKKSSIVSKKPAEKQRPPKQFPIVGIGASAGGVEASGQLLKYLAADLVVAHRHG